MTTTLDGKVTGEHLRRANHAPVSEENYETNCKYKVGDNRLFDAQADA